MSAPAQIINGKAVAGETLRGFMRRWATGVAVVTAHLDGRPVGCTVNAFTSVSLDPPLLLISLAAASRTLCAITETGVFGINLIAWSQQHLAAQFAARTEDRFRDTPYRLIAGAPVIDDALATAVCVVAQAIPAADHVLVLGTPRWCDAGEGDCPAIFFGGAYAPHKPA